MNKIAIIHLYCHGFSDSDLLDFSLRLSNPSTIAQQQKLELFKSRFEAAATALQTPGLVDKTWVQKNIIRLTDDEINLVRKGQKKDRVLELELEATQIEASEGPSDPMGEDALGFENPEVAKGIDLGSPEGLSENNSIEDEDFPIRVQSSIDRMTDMLSEETLTDDEKREKWKKDYEEKRRKKRNKQSSGRAEDYHRMSPRDKGDKKQNHDPSGMNREISDLKQLSSLKMEDIDISEYLDNKIIQNAHMTDRIKNTLINLEKKIGKPETFTGVISENNSSEGE
jgi:hypothetical protein